ncbi:arsenosugar biosynthesis radical SAM (seleno)protein ArsS [Psychrobacter sp. DD43]|uniref:arsenosugar biosynthesis radical SAM (seleno)protein ArsS n=1 Tax=Psychrobacter sp. DD43 TaxID=2774128 RepID=UPI0019188A3D|nr:arsenosugar biosynthesis radical SAM (seleno)protein ArsS [Psychrobacter sp. DD43]|tara:strand:- start:5148 stop:6116 length:969 start_codon:yes stop_codon:yes gene_type:complete
MKSTIELLEDTDFPTIKRRELKTLQVNMGYLCNMSCVHCHVAASPYRTEMMSRALVELIPKVLQAQNIDTLDLTGGAPEMHEDFEYLVKAARALGVKVIDRCNLTILMVEGYEDMAQFLADNEVEVVASLPCYSLENVDKQRGKGAFDDSILGLHKLNALGYGKSGSNLTLNLVYNPQGATLPPNQQQLEADYKRELKAHFDIEFNQLFALTNMPIQRFGAVLLAKKQFHPYMDLLKANYVASNLTEVMCRSTISVNWLGELFDCDFNQQLEIPVLNKARRHLRDLLTQNPADDDIAIADHCYGCTAGQGSSCGGILEELAI